MAEKMSERELRAVVEAEFQTAMGAPGGEISDERAKAWDFYLSKPLGNEIEGQSQVVSSDVAEVVDGLLPSLLRLFTTAENLVAFDPVGAEDEPMAQQESDYTNYVFFKQNPAFMIMYNWFFDALVQKNGIVKAWWDESEVISTESYQGLNQLELLELLDDEELEPIEQDSREAETIDENGRPVVDTVFDVEFRRVSKKGRVRIEPVPPEQYRISSDSRALDPTDARMVGQEQEIKRSDLLAMGFDKDIVDKLAAEGNQANTEEELSRRDKTDDTMGGPHDRSQDKIKVREAYIKVDFDGDGRSELRQVFTAGNHILSNEPADRQPFHVISPKPLPHKHFGLSKAEDVMDIQEITTTLQRQVLDNLYHTNNPGHAVWEQGMGEHTLDDLLTTRVGSVKRFSRPVNESYAPITVPFTASATFPSLEFYDRMKRNRTGVSPDSEGLSPELLKNIQTSVFAQANDISRMKIEVVARIFAETGIKSLFLHIHELLLKHQQKAERVKLRGEWVEIDPSSWRTRFDMTVNIGLGIGSREQNLLHLNNIWEKQAQVVQNGGMNLLVSPDNLFSTLSEMVKNANLKDPEMFFTNPQGQSAPPPNDEQLQLQAQQQELEQRQQQITQARIQMDQEKEMLRHQREVEKIQQSKQEHQDETLLKLQELEQNFSVEMEKIANKLTEMELESGRNVPGSRV